MLHVGIGQKKESPKRLVILPMTCSTENTNEGPQGRFYNALVQASNPIPTQDSIDQLVGQIMHILLLAFAAALGYAIAVLTNSR